jgi:hypothetical protein
LRRLLFFCTRPFFLPLAVIFSRKWPKIQIKKQPVLPTGCVFENLTNKFLWQITAKPAGFIPQATTN